MLKRIVLLLLFVQVSYGQDYFISKSDLLEICSDIQVVSNFQSQPVKASKNEQDVINKILSVLGVSKSPFILMPCVELDEVAIAISFDGMRYVLYNNGYMDSLSQDDDWDKLFIIAHEVGHHIKGHTLRIIEKSIDYQKETELEADEFAGYILGKLGASQEQAIGYINKYYKPDKKVNSTHGSKLERLSSVMTGYNKAVNLGLEIEFRNKNFNASEFFYIGYNKFNLSDYKGALVEFNKAIELDKKAIYYHNRAITKYNLQDYSGAISDFSKVIESFSNNDYKSKNIPIIYYNMANSKFTLKDFKGAISDYSKAIDLNPNYIDAYYNRANSKLYLKDFNNAIFDFNKVIELNPNFGNAYINRGGAKYNLQNKIGACEDFNKAQRLGIKEAEAILKDFCN